jgi:pimeloyl-ACP methyl ester carboxylesterase
LVGRSAGKTAALLLAAIICGWAIAASAGAAISFAPCAHTTEFGCGHLTVALDPSGAYPGTITLAIRRHRAPAGDDRTAVIALAGGPGQPGLPFAEQSLSLLGAIVATRDLIVFDTRGTGSSHALACHGLEFSGNEDSPGPAINQCAKQLGPTRRFYTTADSVADIEAIRVAGGYEKLVLYGTSYGTKLAEEYAQAYPSHVEALVLDSVVPPNGPDPLSRATFAAVPRILRQLCAGHACAHITRHPNADLANLIRRLGTRGRRARWIGGHGHAHTISITSYSLLDILIQGDLEPTLRSEFPAAVRSAVHGDYAALARLLERAQTSEEGEAEGPPEGFDTALYYATTCEEGLFGWNRAAAPATRLAEAKAQIVALGRSAIAPFTLADALELSDIPECAFWPFTTPAPVAAQAPFPSVPTLILSGADDLRTPTANAREVAAQIPGSKLLVVPNTGHSVLDSDPTGCSSDALQDLFADRPIRPCATATPALFRPTPLAPARLAGVPPARGNSGKAGRTLAAVLLTLTDLDRQLALQALAQLGSGSVSSLSSIDVGGLRSGWAQFTPGRIVLHGYSYVPGVSVSGVIASANAELSVGGRSAAPGALRLGRGRTLSGLLEGRRVSAVSAGASAFDAHTALSRLGGARMALTSRECSRAACASRLRQRF